MMDLGRVVIVDKEELRHVENAELSLVLSKRLEQLDRTDPDWRDYHTLVGITGVKGLEGLVAEGDITMDVEYVERGYIYSKHPGTGDVVGHDSVYVFMTRDQDEDQSVEYVALASMLNDSELLRMLDEESNEVFNEEWERQYHYRKKYPNEEGETTGWME